MQYRQFADLAPDATVLSLADRAVIVPLEDMGDLDGAVEVEADEETGRASMETMPPPIFFRDEETTRSVATSRLCGNSMSQETADIGFDALYSALHGSAAAVAAGRLVDVESA